MDVRVAEWKIEGVFNVRALVWHALRAVENLWRDEVDVLRSRTKFLLPYRHARCKRPYLPYLNN